jgi:hypothetical protein
LWSMHLFGCCDSYFTYNIFMVRRPAGEREGAG